MKKGHAATVAVGATSLGAVGSKIGIAGFFGAIPATWPLALVGAYLAHRLYKAASLDSELPSPPPVILPECAGQGATPGPARMTTVKARRIGEKVRRVA